MGVGLIIGMMAMVAAGFVELERLRAIKESNKAIKIFWKVPQYVLIGASEVFMYVGQFGIF